MPEIAILHAPESWHAGGGADVRMQALAEELGKRYDVTVVTVGPHGEVTAHPTPATRLWSALAGVPPRFSQRFDRRAVAGVHRAVAGADAVVAATLFALPYVLDVDLPVVLDAHNVEAEVTQRLAHTHPSRSRRLAYALSAPWSRRWESAAAARADQVWAVSQRDADWFAAAGCRDVVVVPNGVRVPRSSPPLAGDPVFLFVGSLRAEFNRDGLTWFLRECWPRIRAARPESVVHVVGTGGEEFAGPGVVAHGFVDNLGELYVASRVAVVPLLGGGGTRLKVLEAMAYARPVVSTTIGAEGIDLVAGRDALIADTPEAFASACLGLLDGPHAAAVGRAGRSLVSTRYDWTDIGATAARAIQGLW